MFKKIVPLQNERHGQLKLKPGNTFLFSAGTHIVGIIANEFYRAASTYPIVFVEDKEKDAFRPVVLLGLQPGENLFVTADGRLKILDFDRVTTSSLNRHPVAGPDDGSTSTQESGASFMTATRLLSSALRPTRRRGRKQCRGRT